MTKPDEKLIANCLAGDAAAWRELIEKYQRLVYSVTRKYRLPEHEAADVFQGVWADLYKSLPLLKNPESVGAWLAKVAMRRCLLHKKLMERHASPGGAPPVTVDQAPNAQAIREELERAQEVREALQAMSPRCRELIRMLFYEEPAVPYADVARKLGLAEGSIGFIRGRCLEKLRKALCGNEGPRG